MYYDVLLMEEILHHLGCIKPCKSWDKLLINWCRISSINSITLVLYSHHAMSRRVQGVYGHWGFQCVMKLGVYDEPDISVHKIREEPTMKCFNL